MSAILPIRQAWGEDPAALAKKNEHLLAMKNKIKAVLAAMDLQSQGVNDMALGNRLLEKGLEEIGQVLDLEARPKSARGFLSGSISPRATRPYSALEKDVGGVGAKTAYAFCVNCKQTTQLAQGSPSLGVRKASLE